MSSLDSGYSPFYADSSQNPSSPLAPPDASYPALPVESGEAAAHLLRPIKAEVLALLQELQDWRKADLDNHQRGTRCC